MKPARLHIICEGLTEKYFVTECLEPHLRAFNVEACPALLKTRPGKQGGGAVTVERVVQHIRHSYHGFDYLTTFLDFYGFGSRQGRDKKQLEDDIFKASKNCLGSNFEARKLIPYVQRYEFEGLLFSDVEKFKPVLLDSWNMQAQTKLHKVRSEFNSPEDINNSRETAPSKRLMAIFSQRYNKVVHGPLIAKAIGLAAIRSQCPEFNAWILQLEQLGGR